MRLSEIFRRRPTADDLQRVAEAAAAEAIARAFPVTQPVTPLADPRRTPLQGEQFALAQLRPEGPRGDGRPYHLDEPWSYWVVQNPKHLPGKVVDVYTLRMMADAYDVLRSCIEHLKAEIADTPIEIVPRDPDDGRDYKARIKEATVWLQDDGPLGGWGETRAHFEAKMVEDVLVVGAYACWYAQTLGGRPYAAHMIDASTIRPRVDSMGWPDRETPYEQFIMGVQAAGFRPGELRYEGMHPRSYMPYFVSAVEWLIYLVTAAIKADSWNGEWLQSGNTRKGDVFTLPESWTLEQIKGFSAYWDALLSGSPAESAKSRFLPSGSEKIADHSRHDMDFQLYEEWLMRRTCSVMGVSPAAIGFESSQYKASQESSMSITRRVGVGKLLELRKAFYNDLLRRLGYTELKVQDVTDDEDDRAKRSERLGRDTGAPRLTINEARAEEGKEPVDGGDVILVPASLVPLPLIERQAEATAEVMESQANQMRVDPADVQELGLNDDDADVQRAASASARFVTIEDESHPDGKRVIPISDREIGAGHVTKAVTKFGINDKWADMLRKAHEQGKITTDRHLYGVLSVIRQKSKHGLQGDAQKQAFDAALQAHGAKGTPPAKPDPTPDPEPAKKDADRKSLQSVLDGTVQPHEFDEGDHGETLVDQIASLTDDQLADLATRFVYAHADLDARRAAATREASRMRTMLLTYTTPTGDFDGAAWDRVYKSKQDMLDYYTKRVDDLSTRSSRSRAYKQAVQMIESQRRSMASLDDIKANWAEHQRALTQAQAEADALRDASSAAPLVTGPVLKAALQKRLDDEKSGLSSRIASAIRKAVHEDADMPQWYFDTAILPASHINKHYAVVGRTARTIVARDRGIDLDEVRQYHATTHKYVLRQRDLLLKMPPALRAYVKDTTKADALASLYYGDLTAPAGAEVRDSEAMARLRAYVRGETDPRGQMSEGDVYKLLQDSGLASVLPSSYSLRNARTVLSDPRNAQHMDMVREYTAHNPDNVPVPWSMQATVPFGTDASKTVAHHRDCAMKSAMRDALAARHGSYDTAQAIKAGEWSLSIDARKDGKWGRASAKEMKDALTGHIDAVMSMLPQRMRDGITKNVERVRHSTARAHFSQMDGIRVEYTARSTMAHELMHGMEHQTPEVGLSRTYLMDRAGTDGAPARGSEWIGKYSHSGYGRHETTHIDQFVHPYTGKDYGTRATEIMSMGIEGALYDRQEYDDDLHDHVIGRLWRK